MGHVPSKLCTIRVTPFRFRDASDLVRCEQALHCRVEDDGGATPASGAGEDDDGAVPRASVRRHVGWSETEHRLFLLGLHEYGRGAWRAIANEYVTTRTSTQVRSASGWCFAACLNNRRA